MIGQQLRHFRIVGRLGAGGMGEVYRAEDPQLGREVAIKVLPEALARDPDALARFEREAKAVAALTHPNVLSIFDYGQQDGRVFAVMELLEGETLRERLAHGALPVRKGVELAAAVARGLAAAHAKGIVHRDLKPDNVFLTRDGQVKVLDFGLARALPQSEGETLSLEGGTQPGTVLGTVGYMSPEQVRGEEADERSDVFSLGVVLYEALAGRRAFRGDSAVETMSAILREEPPELATLGVEAPPVLERIVRHCLEKKPDERFQSARDLAFDLESLADPTGTSSATPAARGQRSWRRMAEVLALVAVLALVPLAYLQGRRGADVDSAYPFDDVEMRILPTAGRVVLNARFEPGGESVVVSSAEIGNRPSVQRLRKGSHELTPVGPPGAHLLAVSSEGDLALLLDARYVRHFVFEGTLARLPARGGAPRPIAERVRAADWSPDGEALAIIRVDDGLDHLEYPVGTELAATDGYFSDLRVSPDGERVAVLDHRLRYDNEGRLLVVDRQGARIESAVRSESTEGVAWSPDGERVYFGRCPSEELNCEIAGMDLAGRVHVAYTSPVMQILDVAPDGRWLTLDSEDVSRLIASAAGRGHELDLSWGCWPTQPVISADGRLVAFADLCGPEALENHALVRSSDGSPPVDLGAGRPRAFSPDGRWLLAVDELRAELHLLPLGAGEARRLALPDLRAIQSSWFAPEGERLLLAASAPNRPPRCFEISLVGGPIRPLTPEGTQICAPSPDGRWIAVQWTGSVRTTLVPSDAGAEPHDVPDWPPDLVVLRWSPSGDQLWAAGFRGDGGTDLFTVDPHSGERTLLRHVSVEGPGALATVQIALGDDPRDAFYNVRSKSTKLYEVTGLR